jgi:predicted alpha-1,2-mannosidase
MNLKKISLLLAAACVTGIGVMANAAEKKEVTNYVNPMIGSGGHGHVFVGANVPYGYVQLGPTQTTQGWDWCSGYHYSDSLLIGFGHQHLSGTGIGDLGDFAFLPVKKVGQAKVRFSHDAETVTPGYYAVKLKDPNVFVELTATLRAGMQRYTLGANASKGLFALNLEQGIGWDKMSSCKYTQISKTAIQGYRMSTGWAKEQYDYFYAEFNKPVTLVEGNNNIAYFEYENDGTPLIIKTGLSAVSENNAKENLIKEIPGWNFNAVTEAAKQDWQKELGKINITTDDENAKTIFYTALYHTMIAPSVFCDVNGQYRGADGKVYNGDFTNYTTFSLWDTYRAAHPLMTIIQPERQADFAKTLINIQKQQGRLPVWHLMGNETDCMPGNAGISVLADLVLKGFVPNKKEAFAAMIATTLDKGRGQESMNKNGYVAFDEETTESASKTLEFAVADYSVAKVAQNIGDKKNYKKYLSLGQAYKRLFDKQTGFIRGKDSKGNWRTPFDPFKNIHEKSDFTEGDAWQYTFMVPQDVHGLIKCFGSEQKFISKLDSLFIVSGDHGEDSAPDIAGLIGDYAHGNEPSHHAVYMYAYACQPWKAAKLLRRIYNEMYTNEPDGLSGNEDVGQMSAWYVISTMGLYQVEPAGGKYVFGSPLFNEAEIKVGNGKTFRIVAKNNSKENIYIQSVKLNGKDYKKSYIYYNDIMRGGTLEFTMGNKPSKFGVAKNARP